MPNLKDLKNRIESVKSTRKITKAMQMVAAAKLRRAQDSAEVVAQRMSKAADEISHYREYDYIIVNRDLDESVEAVRAILTAERLKRDRRLGLTDFVKLLREGR